MRGPGHTRVLYGVVGPASGHALRTTVNLQPPSSVLFGEQQMRMLEATHAMIPQIAPTTPGMPPAKPIIEKRELQQRVTAARETCACSGAAVQLSVWIAHVTEEKACAGEAAAGMRCERGWRTRRSTR